MTWRGGREGSPGRGYVYTHAADSGCCTSDINTTCKAIIRQLKDTHNGIRYKQTNAGINHLQQRSPERSPQSTGSPLLLGPLAVFTDGCSLASCAPLSLCILPSRLAAWPPSSEKSLKTHYLRLALSNSGIPPGWHVPLLLYPGIQCEPWNPHSDF